VAPTEDVGKRFEHGESEEDEVEGHRWSRVSDPAQPEKRF
jgi:hypothetical protein